jgi:hypothetical protein
VIAINVLTKFGYEIKLADDVIKNFEPRAEFYIENIGHITILMPTDKEPQDGHRYCHYLVCDKWYESFSTSDYESLARLEKRTHHMTFDFIEEEEDEDD